MNARQLFGNFFKLIGGALILVGAIQALGTLFFMQQAREVQGTVTGYERVEGAAPPFIGGDAGVLYYPVVRFDTPAGRRVEFTAPSGRNSRVYDIDEQVRVYYDPDEPETGRLGSAWGLWGSTIVFAGLGAVFVVIGFLAPYGFGHGRNRDVGPFGLTGGNGHDA
ncbi:MAG: DUF3592 domain-containing protein [Spirochaetes bacterium]|jgi:hypothetical protein|nr:DUF3592 domain-containing protein [Spirochaetota bacterium]